MARKKEEKVVEEVVKDNGAEVVENTAVEEPAAESVSVETETVEASAEVPEAPRQKRKYTKRKTADSKAVEKASSKKSKKDAKLVENVQELYIELGDNKVHTEDIFNRIKETYKSEGHRISSIKKLQVYMNLDERKAYYVINDKPEGKSISF